MFTPNINIKRHVDKITGGIFTITQLIVAMLSSCLNYMQKSETAAYPELVKKAEEQHKLEEQLCSLIEQHDIHDIIGVLQDGEIFYSDLERDIQDLNIRCQKQSKHRLDEFVKIYLEKMAACKARINRRIQAYAQQSIADDFNADSHDTGLAGEQTNTETRFVQNQDADKDGQQATEQPVLHNNSDFSGGMSHEDLEAYKQVLEYTTSIREKIIASIIENARQRTEPVIQPELKGLAQPQNTNANADTSTILPEDDMVQAEGTTAINTQPAQSAENNRADAEKSVDVDTSDCALLPPETTVAKAQPESGDADAQQDANTLPDAGVLIDTPRLPQAEDEQDADALAPVTTSSAAKPTVLSRSRLYPVLMNQRSRIEHQNQRRNLLPVAAALNTRNSLLLNEKPLYRTYEIDPKYYLNTADVVLEPIPIGFYSRQ